MLEFLAQHQFWTAVGIYWIVSAAVSSMPEPAGNGRPAYIWLYRFLHTIAGNVTTAFGNKIPGAKILLLILTIGILTIGIALPVSACAAHYTMHPGALNPADSAAYDTLLIAEAAIDHGRMEFQAGHLPAAARPSLDTLVKVYNVTRESWLTYRGAIATNVPPAAYFNQLTRNLSDLTDAIRKFQSGGQ